jgi:hypothetical protein
MAQYCSDCGKEFKNNNRAIAVTTGYIDYKNNNGFKADENEWLAIHCIRCHNKRTAALSNLVAVVIEFIEDIESCYGNHSENLYKATKLDKEWYDLAQTYDKAKKYIKDIKWLT